MYSGRIPRLGGISELTVIENNSLSIGRVPRGFAVRSFNYDPSNLTKRDLGQLPSPLADGKREKEK